MIVYFIQAHRDERQVLNLASLLLADPASFVIVSYDSHLPELLRSGRANYMARTARRRIHRGDFSPVDEYLDALRWLRDERIGYDWFVNLCGQSLPVQPMAVISGEIAKLKCDAVMHHFPMFSAESDWPAREEQARVLFRWRRLTDRQLTRGERAILKGITLGMNAVQSRFRLNTSYGLQTGTRTRPPEGLTFHGGSYFKYVSRRCGEHLLDCCERQPEVMDFFRHTLVPDEIFTQTILLNHPFQISGDNRMFFRFAGKKGGHPERLEEEDIASAAGFHFARKFEFESPAYRRVMAGIGLPG